MVSPRYTIRHLPGGNDSINRHGNCSSTASTGEGKQPRWCELTQVIEGILSYHDCIQAAVDDKCLHKESNEDSCHDVSFGSYILHKVKQLRNDIRTERRGKGKKCSYYTYRGDLPSCSITAPISFCSPIAAAINEMIANGVILMIQPIKSTNVWKFGHIGEGKDSMLQKLEFVCLSDERR